MNHRLSKRMKAMAIIYVTLLGHRASQINVVTHDHPLHDAVKDFQCFHTFTCLPVLPLATLSQDPLPFGQTSRSHPFVRSQSSTFVLSLPPHADLKTKWGSTTGKNVPRTGSMKIQTTSKSAMRQAVIAGVSSIN